MLHEDLTRDQQVEGSTNRSFGLVFTCVFLIIAVWPVFTGHSLRWWAGGVAVAFATVSLAKPEVLTPLNALWTKLGIFLGKIVAPIAMGVLFYAVITPLAVVMRISGKDPLKLERDATAESYWVSREPPGPPPDSMTNQF
jgi:hypothetical protein